MKKKGEGGGDTLPPNTLCQIYPLTCKDQPQQREKEGGGRNSLNGHYKVYFTLIS